ncbi:hypothetical protein Leryth_014983 [Lithospermum erythrorhizon]|nr:hypothetical protein Leryth_014983 [Lithospermum erythrorhizon]
MGSGGTGGPEPPWFLHEDTHMECSRFPSWESCSNFDAIENGRIFVVWDVCRVACDVLEIGRQYIHVKVLCKETQQSFLATFVYPLCHVNTRKEIWEHISSLGPSINLPWMVLWDFNCYLKPCEKKGGKKLLAYELKDLGECMRICGLVDAPSTGLKFSWTNGSLWTKLDRVLMNDVWHRKGLMCLANFLPMLLSSDHCQVVTSVLHKREEGSRPFKFFNMWLKHSDFKETLTTSWGMVVNRSDQYILCLKLKALKRPLKKLNKRVLGGILGKVSKVRTEFQEVVDLAI